MKHLSLRTEGVFISQAGNHGSQVRDRVSEVPGSLVFVPNDRRMLAADCLEHRLETGEPIESSEMEVNLFSGHAAQWCKLGANYPGQHVRRAVSVGWFKTSSSDNSGGR